MQKPGKYKGTMGHGRGIKRGMAGCKSPDGENGGGGDPN